MNQRVFQRVVLWEGKKSQPRDEFFFNLEKYCSCEEEVHGEVGPPDEFQSPTPSPGVGGGKKRKMQAKPKKTSGQKKREEEGTRRGLRDWGSAVNLVPKGRLREMKSRVLSCATSEITFGMWGLDH